MTALAIYPSSSSTRVDNIPTDHRTAHNSRAILLQIDVSEGLWSPCLIEPTHSVCLSTIRHRGAANTPSPLHYATLSSAPRSKSGPRRQHHAAMAPPTAGIAKLVATDGRRAPDRPSAIRDRPTARGSRGACIVLAIHRLLRSRRREVRHP